MRAMWEQGEQKLLLTQDNFWPSWKEATSGATEVLWKGRQCSSPRPKPSGSKAVCSIGIRREGPGCPRSKQAHQSLIPKQAM